MTTRTPLNDDNLILDTDSYKSSHFLQYPQGTTRLFSYLESRGGRYPQTRFFGLQYILDRYLTTRITADMVEEARTLIEAHGEPFPYDGWMRIVNHPPDRVRTSISWGTKVSSTARASSEKRS